MSVSQLTYTTSGSAAFSTTKPTFAVNGSFYTPTKSALLITNTSVLAYSSPWTIEFFFYVASTTNVNQGIFETSYTDNNNTICMFFNGSTGATSRPIYTQVFVNNSSSAVVNYSTSSYASLTTWYHAGVMYDGAYTLYELFNGTITTRSTSTLIPITSLSNQLMIGSAKYTNSVSALLGYVSNFRISNTLRYSGASYTIPTSNLSQDSMSVYLNTFDQSSGTNFTATAYTILPCLCVGMLIRTPNGDTPIEKLRVGDLVTTHDGRDVPIVDYTRTVVRGDYYNIPFRIPASHFDPGYPSKDILLSPNHMFFCGGWKVPAQTKGLLDETALLGKEFEYFNIALPNYGEDKLSCHGIGVDSWNTRAKLMY